MTTITRQELRSHYATIRDMIAEERALRQVVLANSPKLKQKLQKCDDALASLASLATLGNALAALLPAEDPIVMQEALFPMPPEKRGY